jgi:AcrR family transcriptional regulator
MAKTLDDKRSRLVRAAAELSHTHGFAKISLADIAEQADVPLGNIYYYFKTKAAIGEAVILQRVAEIQQLAESCDAAGSPRDRLQAFVRMTVQSRAELARAGCPVGSLCAELSKDTEALGDQSAAPFRELLAWLEAQFVALGHTEDRRTLALHLLAALQGVSLLANCFHDPSLVVREAKLLKGWIDSL